jgi:hypothetical protein
VDLTHARDMSEQPIPSQNLTRDRIYCTRSTKEGVEAWYIRHLKPSLGEQALIQDLAALAWPDLAAQLMY